ncbi:MAG: TIGR02206 family membrane protein [Bryobacteraceae bacterium]
MARQARRGRLSTPTVARGLGVALAVNEIDWYAYRVAGEGLRFPTVLPLNLCDLVLWLTVAAAPFGSAALFELAYFAGIAGSSMALLTPDLSEPRDWYGTLHYFSSHGGIVVTLLVLLWTGLHRPRPNTQWRSLAILAGFAAAVGAFNVTFDTNYMYLCRKPRNPSLLDYMGPWPWYIAAGSAAAGLLFWLLALPFRRQAPGEW